MAKARSKRYKESMSFLEFGKKYPLDKAVEVLKSTKSAKFDETVEIAISLNIDAKKSDQLVRGAYALPKGTGKKIRVAVFAEGEFADEAKQAGSDIVGAQDLVDKIQKGFLDFDVAIAHPNMMKIIGKIGKVLGTKGLMPSPKSGTVTKDIGITVKEFKAGKVKFKNDAGGNIHAIVGKKSFAKEALIENINAFIEHIKGLKPSAVKGIYMRKVSISSTMSPGIQILIS